MVNRMKGEERSKVQGKGLTDNDIRHIRAFPRVKGHLKVLATEYNISVPLVSMIRHRKKWAHVKQYPNGCIIGAPTPEQL